MNSPKLSPQSSEESPLPPTDEESTWHLPASSGRPSPAVFVVRVVGAEASPAAIRVLEGTHKVGSGRGCSIVINDPVVSRQHLELEVTPRGVTVRDLSSTNGTHYLGSRIQEILLPSGGAISIGQILVSIEQEVDFTGEILEFNGTEYGGMVGVSAAMRRLFALLRRLERSIVPVLIQGESGVGKELIARALHAGSPVSNGPFVVVNCGAIPHDLITSELFGHKKGAFTGALDTRLGAFENADGGTLFLDEIGELPLDMQPVLLRVLESGEVRPVGSDQTRTVNVRIVSATNRDLRSAVAEQKFRRDLLYRLGVVRLDVPPLRDRPEDIEPLAERFAQAAQMPPLSAQVIARLRSNQWPGNARELRNVVQAYGALGVLLDSDQPKNAILEVALSHHVNLKRPYLELKEALNDQFTQIYLRQVLEQANGNKSAAARIAGLDRTYLNRLLTKHGFSKD